MGPCTWGTIVLEVGMLPHARSAEQGPGVSTLGPRVSGIESSWIALNTVCLVLSVIMFLSGLSVTDVRNLQPRRMLG